MVSSSRYHDSTCSFIYARLYTSTSYAVPSAVKRILDEQMTVITINIPRDCDPKAPEKQKELVLKDFERTRQSGYLKDGKIMMGPITEKTFDNSKLLQFLASKGYVSVQVLDMRHYYVQYYKDTGLFKFYYYTDKIAPYIMGAYKFGMKGNPPILVCGKRKLKSIDYSNKFNTEMYGMGKVDIWALTYSYQLEVVFPEFELVQPGKIFKGKLQALKDPRDGKWKIVESEKQDSGSREFSFKE